MRATKNRRIRESGASSVALFARASIESFRGADDGTMELHNYSSDKVSRRCTLCAFRNTARPCGGLSNCICSRPADGCYRRYKYYGKYRERRYVSFATDYYCEIACDYSAISV